MADEFPYVLFVEGEWDPNTPKLKNKLTIYFQSKRSNGGDCCVQLLGGQRATVSFKTEEVRQHVLERKSHEITIGQKVVSLNIHLSSEEASAAQELQSPIKAYRPDIPHSADTDAVDLKRRKEGCSEQSSVLDFKKPRLFDDRSQEEPPAKDEEPPTAEPESEEPEEQAETEGRRSAVLENIREMNQEFLIMLVENVIKDAPESKDFSIEVIPESNCAVVTFSNKKGAGNFILSCPNNSVFRKKDLNVRLLEVTTKVKAEDLPSNLSSDYITLYFEKYGETDGEVVMLEDGLSAIISFQDQTAVNTVLRTQHQIKKQPIKVFPYYDSLGTALYGKDRPILRLPETFTEDIDESIRKYLQDNQGKLDLIKQEMCKHFCQLALQDSSVKISPLASLLHQGLQTRKLIQTWREKASAEFATAMSKYKSLEINILRDAWSETVAEIRKALSAEPVTLVLHEDQATAILAGLAEDVCRTEDVMHSTIDRITQRIQREKGSVTDEINMASSIYEIVMFGGLEQEIHNSFPKMELSYHSHSQNLVLYGLKQEVLESKNKILQGVIGLNRSVVELHPSVLEFLTKREQEKLTSDLFLSKGISASLEIKDNRASLIAKTERALKDSEEHMKAVLGYKCLDVEDISVIRRAEWQDLITSLNNMYNSSVKVVLINTLGDQVMVSGFAEVVKLVLEQLNDFLEDNSNITVTLKADKIVVRFIQEHKKQDWFELVKNKVNIDFKDDRILLNGPRVHVFQCKPVFEDLLSSVYQDNLKVAKPGAKKFFKSKEAMYVAAAKNNTGCLVELVDEDEVLQAGGVSRGKKGVLTPEGAEIVVSNGDMCSYPVDAVVNAANEKLDFSGGLSKAISDAAGPQLQDACHQIIKTRKQLNAGDAVLTKAGGQLCCKYVIHAVGPHFDMSDSQKSVGLLKKAVKKSLNLADRENCQSMAIPAISSGTLGFPLDLCANSIVEAIKEFFEVVNEEDLCVKKIHLVDKNDRTVEALKTAVQNVYGGSSTSQGITSRGNSSQHQQNTKTQKHLPSVSNQGSSQSVKTKEGLTITLSKCNIQDTSMDVVVNSIFSDLSLKHGAISNAILSAAGPQLQTLLNQQVTGNVNVGDVFVTTGGNLKNKLVFHALPPHWKQGQGQEQKALEGIMDKCLGQAEQQQQKSIVFPAIGTGNLGFPKALVASLMLDSVLKFSKKRASSHVQEVMFALNPQDTPTLQAFTNEFNNKFNIQTSSTQQQSKGPFSKITSKSGIHETTVGGVVLQVLSGDITKQNTDVIVNSSNENFTLKAGVSKAVLDAAGPNVEAECAQLGAQQNQGLIMTQPGTLQCKKIIHVSAKSDPATIHRRVKQVLQMTAQQKLTSISFPALGTGQGGANPGQVADSMLDAVLDFVTKTPNSSIKMVRMVIFQAPMLTDFQQSMQKREGGSDKQKKEGVFSKAASFAKSLFIGSKNKDDQQKKGKDFVIEGKAVNAACFSICGPSRASVDQAKQWIEKLILDELAFELISDPMVLNLSDKDQQRIQELQQSMDVSVRLEQKAQGGGSEEATILVEGLSRDVLVAVSEIQAMLRKTRDEFSLRKDIEFASGIVEWQYQQGGQYQSFDQLTNFHLEKALTLKSPHVDITVQGQAYKVTMPEGPAVSAAGNQMSIRRIDKLQVPVIDSLPQEWDTMTPTELCKVCPLQPGNKEFNDVLSHFRKTCPNNNVLTIARIQNPGMWKKYQSNKHIMGIKNGHQNNERRLFHGTREDSMKHINHSGFNRSYAGVNATAYGKGTYFASYSSSNTYSVPNLQGHKHMYFCRVLTGDFTVGNSSMFVPPPKSANSIDLYDTVVDRPNAPTIFVVFRDDHAYPEYLITFT